MVSPCSQCKNHLLELPAGDTSHTLCPRRQWILLNNNQSTDNPNPSEPIAPYLYESGTDDQNTLANPVYSTNNGTMLIWVALAQNNGDLYDSDGNIVRNSIESPAFDVTKDSEFLNCELLPYVPHDTQARVYGDGVLHEQDQIYADTFYSRQNNPDGTQQAFEGTVQKVTHPFFFNLQSSLRDNNPAGC